MVRDGQGWLGVAQDRLFPSTDHFSPVPRQLYHSREKNVIYFGLQAVHDESPVILDERVPA